MRRYALIVVLCWASPAMADKTQATQLMVNNLVSTLGADVAQATSIARCFVDRMTDAQAESYVAAHTEAARQEIVTPLVQNADVGLCVQQAMGG